ncbi:hypothetical protein [Melittangium boletus]|uniref:Methyltransferase domain-containing protein n=1 Tax=Melittangium boletus DSM 14713 TaxID=1294270 RepID=A0A250IKV0_9BACT|nr:hypothetical protein [Melittangium boletus]ATB31898.1 hypothetical protein MEBOL_005370 [Melittangium boletus DSM 14713]
MADKRRFDLFAQFLVERFAASRVFDIAGGQGRLNQALSQRGCTVTTFDLRHKRLPVRYAERLFTLDEPCECDLLVGMHPDGATRVIIEYAAKHRLPFAVVPCCSDNGMPYNPWRRHLAELARGLGFPLVEEHVLPMEGRATVVLGAFSGSAREPGAGAQ